MEELLPIERLKLEVMEATTINIRMERKKINTPVPIILAPGFLFIIPERTERIDSIDVKITSIIKIMPL